MQLAGNAARPLGQRKTLREFVGKDVPQVLEHCRGCCASTHGHLHEVRLQDLLLEEHAGAAEATGATLDQLATKVDRLADIIEGQRDAVAAELLLQVRRSMGELLDEKVAQLMLQLDALRGDVSAQPAPGQGAARVAPQLTRQDAQERGALAREPPGTPVDARESSGGGRSTMTQVLAGMPGDAGDMVHAQERASRKSLRGRIGEYYRDQIRSIRDQRLKTHASWLKIVVRSFAFEVFFSMVITAHLAYMVVDTDLSFGVHGTGRTGLAFEVCFLALYMVELMLKIAVDGCGFFSGPGWPSNLFDLFLVAGGSVDAASLLFADGGLFNSTALQALRVFRLPRAFRTRRVVGVASDVQGVLRGLAACAGVLVGAGLLVLTYFLVLGIFFSQAVGSYITESGGEVQGEALEFYATNFGTVSRTMLTLYQCASGGRDWARTWDALVPVWPGGALAAVLVILDFGYLVLMVNVVSSACVQKALLHSPGQAQGARLQLERGDREDARLILEGCDRHLGGGDTLSYKELLRLLLVPEVRELFDIRGIRLEDARVLHRTLAEKPAGPELPQEWEPNVNRGEFCRLCMRLGRDISTADLAKSDCALRHFETGQHEHNQHVEASMDKLRKQLDHAVHCARQ